MELENITILLIEHDSETVQKIKNILNTSSDSQFELVNVSRISDGISCINRGEVDLIIVDLNLPESQGFNTFLILKKQAKRLPIIVLINEDEIPIGLNAVKEGAQDIFLKNLLDSKLLTRSMYCSIQRHKVLKVLLSKIKDVMSSEIRLLNIIENNGDGIIIIDSRGKIRFFSPAAESLFGKKTEEMMGQPFDYPVKANESSEIKITHPEAGMITAEMRAVKIDWDSEEAFLVSLHDISELKKAREVEQYLAYHDTLTNLPNRLLFYDRLNHSLAQAKRYGYKIAVLFLDLDKFKPINDTLGHHVGDLLLKSIANRLTECLRESDTLARLGGDEFTIILDHLYQPQDSDKVAKKILNKISEPFIIEDNHIRITTSIGISFYPGDGENTDTLIKNADIAMYLAKKERNNYQYFNETREAEAFERLNLEKSLRHALENDELVLHYQPQVDLYTNKIKGVEALVRWQHPELGLLPPSRFISLAEETGLIVPLGEWVIYTACKQNKAWQKAGFPSLRVAVNLSARQFRVMQLESIVNQVLESTKLNPNCLVLEITESCAMQNVEYTISTLNTLKEMGVQISMDDFGTGYASLSYLKRFPLDILKIDRSFVNGLHSYHDDWAIVSAIVAMAHRLKLNVLAEGVENADQLVFLRTLKCDEIQGFYFSTPVPVNELSILLKSNISHNELLPCQ